MSMSLSIAMSSFWSWSFKYSNFCPKLLKYALRAEKTLKVHWEPTPHFISLWPSQVSSLFWSFVGKVIKEALQTKNCLSCGWEDMAGQRIRATITGNSKLKKQYLLSVKALTTETWYTCSRWDSMNTKKGEPTKKSVIKVGIFDPCSTPTFTKLGHPKMFSDLLGV